MIFLMTGAVSALDIRPDERMAGQKAHAGLEAAGAEPHNCKDNEVPYFEAGCEGRGSVKCWPQNIRPTPMETCLCNGKQGNAPLPGGGLRWRHAGKCKP